MVHLDYRDARPIYIQIVDGFKTQILAGVLEAGEKLPSVRELATELSITPNTIQRAYAELESEGYTYSVPGKGSFAASRGEADQARRAELVEKFRSLTGELLGLGLSREELEALVKEGVS